MPAPVLSLSSVSFAYRALPVLRDIHWRFERGQQWACLGPNGSGKTTLARLILGQLPCASGRIDIEASHRRIAYVCFEEQKALCERDAKLDDSDFRGDAQDPGTQVQSAILGTRKPDDRFRHWVARLGIAHILERGIRFISTGEMRKTLLLRAILGEPRLLILDSPLDGLDIASQREMRAILDRLLRSPMRLLLLCRDLADPPEAVTHVLALQAGRILCHGPRGAVLAREDVGNLMRPPRLALGELPPPCPRPYRLAAQQPLLALRGVSVRYGEAEVLRDVSWTFSPGQHCCISGPNGCGKTTLLSLVNGDSHMAYGQDITLFGLRRGSGESVWDIKRKYGVVNTRMQLGHARGMRVLEVVVSGFFDSVGLYDDSGDRQRLAARHWLRALGIAELERAPFDTLSFGMQRMALLARAMVKSPLILILDEPCIGLDSHHRDTILRTIDHIAAHSDTQVLYVSHAEGEAPGCINQWLEFTPVEGGFRCRVSSRRRQSEAARQ